MKRIDEYVESLKACGVKDVRVNENLINHCTWHINGVCEVLVCPKDSAEVALCMRYANDLGLPIKVIGFGSNILFAPLVKGVVLKLDNLKNMQIREDGLFFEAGLSLGYIASIYANNSKKDMAFAANIPGSLGGAIAMNAGAYGGCMADVVKEVYCCYKGELLIMQNDEAEFGYRSSRFKNMPYTVIVGALLKADEDCDSESIKKQIKENAKNRALKQPLEFANCGSVFKNPENFSAGKLIEDCNLKGVKIGGAEISTKHANFIVNVDKATSSDVLALINLIKARVKEKFNIDLQTEVELVGFDDV